ncbi:MAG: aspartate/glutamate racemase family protein [Paraclostridium sp.]
MKTVGIIGGMGPMATMDLVNKILCITPAKCDNEHIPMIIDNNTQIPDRTDFILGRGLDPTDELIKSAKNLEKIGSDFLVIPCNTAHYFYENIKNSVNIEVINMIEEVANFIESKSSDINRIGLLSTVGTIEGRVYDNIFEKRNIDVIKPIKEEQEIIMDLIYGIKQRRQKFDKNKIKKIIYDLKSEGVQYIVLGCTELPIAVNLLKIEGCFIDPSNILAEVIVKKVLENV